MNPYDWVQLFTCYETASIARHLFGVHYKVSFVAERSSVKDTLSMALAKTCSHKQETHGYVL